MSQAQDYSLANARTVILFLTPGNAGKLYDVI
jgi:hypothetical protein